jgi:hypothetical protein
MPTFVRRTMPVFTAYSRGASRLESKDVCKGETAGIAWRWQVFGMKGSNDASTPQDFSSIYYDAYEAVEETTCKNISDEATQDWEVEFNLGGFFDNSPDFKSSNTIFIKNPMALVIQGYFPEVQRFSQFNLSYLNFNAQYVNYPHLISQDSIAIDPRLGKSDGCTILNKSFKKFNYSGPTDASIMADVRSDLEEEIGGEGEFESTEIDKSCGTYSSIFNYVKNKPDAVKAQGEIVFIRN